MVTDAYDRRDIGTFGVPGVYLHANFPKVTHVLLKVRGDLVDIMFYFNPEHIKNVI